MTTNDLNSLFNTVVNGIITLHNSLDASEDDPTTQPGRVLFYALSGYLYEKGVVHSMASCSEYLESRRAANRVPAKKQTFLN